MKNLFQKWKASLIFQDARNRLMAIDLTDPDPTFNLRQIYVTGTNNKRPSTAVCP